MVVSVGFAYRKFTVLRLKNGELAFGKVESLRFAKKFKLNLIFYNGVCVIAKCFVDCDRPV